MLDGKDQISLRQIMSIIFIGILSPMIKVMPSQTTLVSGKGTWLASLFTIFPLLLFVWVIKTLMCNRAGTRHLGEIYCHIFGSVGGKILCTIYFIWTFVMMTMTVRDYSDRFMATTYRDDMLGIFMIVLLAMAFFTARGKLRAFGRVGEICMRLLTVVIIAILILATSTLSLSRVMAVTPQDALRATKSVPACMSIVGVSLYAAFLGSSIRREQKPAKKMIKWIVLFLLLITAMQITILGTLGIELTTHLQFPLFIMVKNIAIFDVVERIESIVVALWVIADYALVSLLAVAALAILKFLFNLKSTRQMISPIVLLVFSLSILVSTSSFVHKVFTRTFVRAGDLILFFLVPVIAVIVGKIRKVV